MKKAFKEIEDGVCAPLGYEAAGVACGIKSADSPSGGRDIAIVRSVVPAACAALFTTNVVKSAHIPICIKRIAAGKTQAVIVNSGNANCLTGKQGVQDALDATALGAQLMGIKSEHTLIWSTGIIGHKLPMAKVRKGIKEAAQQLSRDSALDAAWAITTTDTHPKTAAVEIKINGKAVRIGGMAKGAGMISPNMATMLAFLCTDADIPAASLKTCLKRAAQDSFNAITIDNDMSPSDTLFLMANGQSGVKLKGYDLQFFQEGLNHIANKLAQMIVRDGEGATKFVAITVSGTSNRDNAARIARSIANSLLVKCAIHGADPNWGRILTSAGAAGVQFDPAKAELTVAGVKMIQNGEPIAFNKRLAHQALSKPEIDILLNLHSGPGSATIYTCDLSEEYVTFNADYHT